MMNKRKLDALIAKANGRKTWEDFNEEFQHLWNKYQRVDWKKENLAGYCSALESMIINFLVRNKALDRSTQLFP